MGQNQSTQSQQQLQRDRSLRQDRTGRNNYPNNIGVENSITLGTVFLFIQLSQMLFRPLRQIADKFNTLQMGMVAATRVFKVLDTSSQIDDKGTHIAEHFKGSIKFNDVYFIWFCINIYKHFRCNSQIIFRNKFTRYIKHL